MTQVDFNHARLLAEILRLQRWAGGDSVPAHRIYGLMHGFESTWEQEVASFGISKETQSMVEDVLDDIENNRQSEEGRAIKDRLRKDKIDESDAIKVCHLCRFESRFLNAVEKLEKVFSSLRRPRFPEQDWRGALHYMELVDCTENVHRKLHAVLAPSVPRIGETVTPQRGSAMRVVQVEHCVVTIGEEEGMTLPVLVPYIYLEIEDNDNDIISSPVSMPEHKDEPA